VNEGLATVNAGNTIFAVWGQAIIDKIKELMESAGFKTEDVNLMKSNFYKARYMYGKSQNDLMSLPGNDSYAQYRVGSLMHVHYNIK
jgi:hypothetical protein